MNIYITLDRRKQLKRYAKKHRLSMSAVIDMALDQLISATEPIIDHGSPMSEVSETPDASEPTELDSDTDTK